MTIDKIRQLAATLVSALAIIFAIAAAAIEFATTSGFGLVTMIAAAGAASLLATFFMARQSAAFRYLAVSVLMAQIMVALVAASGQVWQTDLHMAFFAALAITALLYDIKAILLGAVLVAIHHLGLGMLLPDLIFFNGGGFWRVALHAVILVIEAAGLIWMTYNTHKLFSVAQEQSSQAKASATEAQGLAREIEESQSAYKADRSRTMAKLRAEFGDVVSAAVNGDFSKRVRTDADEEDLNALAASINSLVETVERGLSETSKVLSALSQNDLTLRFSGNFGGAFAKLQADTNTVADKLSDLVSTIRDASSGLRMATSEILTGADELAQRTSRQAEGVEQTSASMEKLSATVEENAGRARTASLSASKVSETATTGGEVMTNVTGAMDRIRSSSEQISGIIGLIDDIAFQTNLLALNASVEAARAGEAGKGFAVVAVEVRRLAQSAAEASSQVKALVEQSGSQVTDGARLVEQAYKTLREIIVAAGDTNRLMQDIARDSSTQSGALASLGASVRQIDEYTQQNAALVEETNANIEQSEAQARALEQLVSVFQIDEGRPSHRNAA